VFRQQALGWLRAEVDSYEKAVDSDPPAARAATYGALQHWLSDPDLASVRDPAALGGRWAFPGGPPPSPRR
jgi:hypothetical protein